MILNWSPQAPGSNPPHLQFVFFSSFPPAAAQTPHDIVDLGLHLKTIHNRLSSTSLHCIALCYCSIQLLSRSSLQYGFMYFLQDHQGYIYITPSVSNNCYAIVATWQPLPMDTSLRFCINNRWHPLIQAFWERQGLCVPWYPAFEPWPRGELFLPSSPARSRLARGNSHQYAEYHVYIYIPFVISIHAICTEKNIVADQFITITVHC